jgi:hypothetical protein
MWSNSTMCDMKSSCSAGYSRSLNTIWNILKSPREAVCSVCAFSVSEDSREVFRWRIFHQIKYIGLVPSANNAISSRSCCNILTFPVGRWHSVMQVEKGRVSEHSRRYRTQFESPLNAKMSIRRSQRQSYCFRVCGRQLIPCIALEGSGAWVTRRDETVLRVSNLRTDNYFTSLTISAAGIKMLNVISRNGTSSF